jgi:hypothetical protein
MWETRAAAGDDILKNIDTISHNAKEKASNPDVFVPSGSWSNTNAVKKATKTRELYAEAYHKLSREPLVAAVHVETETGDERVYFFSRRIQAPDMEAGYYTHLMAPIGSLATYDPGDIYTFNDQYDLKVLSKIVVTPTNEGNIWDCAPTELHWKEDTPVRLSSLLRFLEKEPKAKDKHRKIVTEILDIPSIDDDIELDAIGEETLSDGDESEAFGRELLRGTGLRDQAVLDKVQDNIFRLPLNSQLMISGPPGSGKTTTLVRRLAQKSDVEFLTKSELDSIQSANNPDLPHELSWILFTPSELLETYLAETFSREGIAAPKDRIWTWEKYSLTIARENTHLLRKAGNKEGFVFDGKASNLKFNAIKRPFELTSSLEKWLLKRFYSDLDSALNELSESNDQTVSQTAQKISGSLRRQDANDLFVSMAIITSEANELQRNIKQISLDIDELINGRVRRLLRNRKYDKTEYNRLRDRAERLDRTESDVEELRDFIKKVKYTQEERYQLIQNISLSIANPSRGQNSQTGSSDTVDVSEDDLIKSIRKIVINYANSIEIQQATTRSLLSRIIPRKVETKVSSTPIENRYTRLLEIFGEEIFTLSELNNIHNKTTILQRSSDVLNAPENYFRQIANYYRAFRQEHHKEWYVKKDIDALSLDPIEMDALLFVLIKSANNLIVKKQDNDTKWRFLRKFETILRNQVLVDEASDFSALQLSVMYQISHPLVKAFCASGDFDQGLTLSGVETFEEFKTAVPNITEHSLAVGYRQSSQLAEFTYNFGTKNLNLSSRFRNPDFGQISGVPPAFFEANGNLFTEYDWISGRIQEIEEISPELPSIAILVPSTSMVKSLEIELRKRIQNIPITGYEEPGNLGRDQEIRIFPIQYVKGLEFESAIFSGVDILKQNEPDLFAKYLYVGATRAATFLAITAKERLPKEIVKLKHVSSWRET